jgi:hypothetical protein
MEIRSTAENKFRRKKFAVGAYRGETSPARECHCLEIRHGSVKDNVHLPRAKFQGSK